MRVPILKQRDYLIASIQSALSDEDLLQLRDDLVQQVGKYRSKGAIVDVTVLDVMDSFAVRTLRAIAHMIELRGAVTVIVGIQPEGPLPWSNSASPSRTWRPPPTSRRVSRTSTPRPGRGPPGVPSDAPERLVSIGSAADIVAARREGRSLASRLGFSSSDLTVIATSISEVARNIVEYAGHGEIPLSLCQEGSRCGVCVVAFDKGPGIPDVEKALRDGYSTHRDLGLGIPGAGGSWTSSSSSRRSAPERP
jgi:anti-sigma regulatory factor (Ser/Thr protein kinase)/anti-anti-sigma regulatory factor